MQKSWKGEKILEREVKRDNRRNRELEDHGNVTTLDLLSTSLLIRRLQVLGL
jgi:hypothetical protein